MTYEEHSGHTVAKLSTDATLAHLETWTLNQIIQSAISFRFPQLTMLRNISVGIND